MAKSENISQRLQRNGGSDGGGKRGSGAKSAKTNQRR
jgi:hypothetical protein